MADNDAANASMRQEINAIFNRCRTEPDSPVVKLLATQLTRLETVTHQIKCQRLESDKQTVLTDIDRLHSQMAAAEARKLLLEKALAGNSDNIPINQDDINLIEYRTKSAHRQINAVQKQWFDAVVAAMFDRRDQLLFCQRPIINVDDIATAPILDLNEFLENLIRLQRVLSVIFAVDLPFIDELMATVMPNSRFFDLIRCKEAQMRGEDDEERLEDTTSSVSHLSSPTVGLLLVSVANGKLEISANPPSSHPSALSFLPLLSKTINAQRRASLRQTYLPPSRQLLPPASTTRRVIIPHRILLVPLAKIGTKDFCKLMGVLLKIHINFHMFFVHQRIKYTLLTNFRDLLTRIIRQEPLDEPRQLEVTKLLQEIYNLVVTRHLAPQLRDLNVVEMMAGKDDWERVTKLTYSN